jgi:hypothetical protein
MNDSNSINFEPVGSAAINKQFGVRICQPRMLPGREGNEVEFDYSVYINDNRYGLGFVGDYQESKDRKSAAITIRLDSTSVVDDILELKAVMGCDVADFEFRSVYCRSMALDMEYHVLRNTS